MWQPHLSLLGLGSLVRNGQPSRPTGLEAGARTSRTSVKPGLRSAGHSISIVETNLSLKASIGPGSIPRSGLDLTGVGASSAGLDGLTCAGRNLVAICHLTKPCIPCLPKGLGGGSLPPAPDARNVE